MAWILSRIAPDGPGRFDDDRSSQDNGCFSTCAGIVAGAAIRMHMANFRRDTKGRSAGLASYQDRFTGLVPQTCEHRGSRWGGEEDWRLRDGHAGQPVHSLRLPGVAG